MLKSLGIDSFSPWQAPGKFFFYYNEITFLKKSRKNANFGLPDHADGSNMGLYDKFNYKNHTLHNEFFFDCL